MYSERFELSTKRIKEIPHEDIVRAPFGDYFVKIAAFIGLLQDTYETVCSGKLRELSLVELQTLNRKLYEDVLPANYEQSFGNPAYAVSVVQDAGYDARYGQILSFLYSEIRALIPYVFEQDQEVLTIYFELFIEIYDRFLYAEDDTEPSVAALEKAIYWFQSDYCDILVQKKLEEQLDPARDFAASVITGCDLDDPRYLYYYGEYVSENELGLFALFQKMPEEEVDRLASVYTEGYRIGFANSNKDLSKKEVVEIRFCLGLEKMVRAALPRFRKMGLRATMRRAGTLSLNKRGVYRIGYSSTPANRQYAFDHKEDEALYYDKDFVNRRISVLKAAFRACKYLANRHAGPACIETFGAPPFHPKTKEEALSLDRKQQKLAVEYADWSGRIINEYIIGEERSFTIISFPTPEIGADFEQIFRETVLVNTLDYQLYQQMQQVLIDTLDTAKFVRIQGKGANRTDLSVALHELRDRECETLFENCVADVNIPVGEVFTSPKLTGTNGCLHVSEVYLNGLKYIDLEMIFTDGRISAYRCKNFPREEENLKYIKDNILYHHDWLPLGEFAIGTNTTAYKMAVTYGIEDRLDILIGEKTGPHFAVGDTCYKYDEELISYNPDGKRIVARDNEVTILRKTDPGQAYFHCHTDITIPYHEIGRIVAIDENGEETPILEDGLFVLAGLEELNGPLLKLRE